MANKNQQKQRTSNPRKYTITGIPLNKNGAILSIRGNKYNVEGETEIRVGRSFTKPKVKSKITLEDRVNSFDLSEFKIILKRDEKPVKNLIKQAKKVLKHKNSIIARKA